MTDRCPACRAPAHHVHDEPRAGIPISIDPDPVTWTDALEAVIEGRAVVFAEHAKHGTRYYRATAERIRKGPLPGDTIHTQHSCGRINP